MNKNGDVKAAGINPVEHFLSSGFREGRTPNQVIDVAKSADSFMVLPFAEGSSLDGYDFSLFKELSLTLESDNSVKVAGLPLLVPFVDPAVKTVIYIGVGLLTLESVKQANSIAELVNDNSSNIFWTPVDERLFDKGNTFPGGTSLTLGDGTPPFDLGTVVDNFDDITFFPADNPVLRNLLNDIFEFPQEFFNDDLSSPFLEITSIIESSSYEEARNIALEKIGDIDPATRIPVIGRLGVGKDKIVGFQTLVNGTFKRYRLDYDPIKGPHINVEVGKGSSRVKHEIKFPGLETDVEKLLRGL